MTNCSNCGAPNEPAAGFCDQCGTPLAGAGMAASAPVIPAAITPSAGGNTCPSCGTAVIPGEAFCDGCGAQLGIAGPVPIAMPPSPPSVVQPQIFTPQPQQFSGSYPPSPASSAPAQIVAGDGQSFTLAGKPSYVIGREDAVSGVYPEVDTSSSGGEAGGVSRRHAEIIQQGGQWFIQDLNSTNGTHVNNQRVMAGGRQPINSGDQIRLGKWMATFQA